MYGVVHGVSNLLDPVLLGGSMPSANSSSLKDALINQHTIHEQTVDDEYKGHMYLEYTKYKIASTT